MKTGEVANGKKFDKGKHEVEKAYGKQGYIQAHLNSTPEFDDGARQVTFKIDVTEGPQFRMGTVDFKGFAEADSAALKDSWKLKTGDVFDSSYLDRFFREDARAVISRLFQERRATSKKPPSVDPQTRVNRKSLTVDITIELKN